MSQNVFDTQTKYQRKFIAKVKNKGIDVALKWLKKQGDKDFSIPNKLTLKWKGKKDKYIVEISENVDFTNAQKIISNKNSCNVENLKIGQTYYWRVDGGKIKSFKTLSNGVRFIHLEGMSNVRDLGGKKIKQGVIFRGSELEGKFNDITANGRYYFENVLKIKSEIDLRALDYTEKTTSAIDGVKMIKISYRPYIEVFEQQHKEELCEIMEFLSDKDNYPVYFHCIQGADRTGMIALFLKALCGEDEQDVLLDYELTSLGRIPKLDPRSRNFDYFKKFIEELSKYAPNQSLQNKVKAFMLDCGISEESINKTVEILTK